MLDHNDLKWIASTSTELNSLLQQMSRYCDLARRHRGEHHYVDLLSERVEMAAKRAQSMFDRVTARILANTNKTSAPPPPIGQTPPAFTIVPPPDRPVVQQLAQTFAAMEMAEKSHAIAQQTTKRRESSAPETMPVDIQVRNPNGNRELLLLIEDEAEVADLAAEMLLEEGYKVIVAHDGFEALRIYEKMGRQIGLVILDFFLPVMDGDAVFDELRSLNPQINVVLSSGFAEQSKIGSMLAQGLRGFIPKPYTREKLLEQVRSTLDAAREAAR